MEGISGAKPDIDSHFPERHFRTAPPAASTRAVAPATSHIFGLSKRATRNMPAATNAHSIAAEPRLRVSQFLSWAATVEAPARRRRTAGFNFGVTSLFSKRNLPPALA